MDLKILNDNRRLYLGAGNDLSIFHSGSENFIRCANSASRLYIDCTEHLRVRHLDTNGLNDESMIYAKGDGAVELYYDGSKKFETTSIGVNIHGGDTGGSYIVGDMYWDNGTNAGRDVHWDQSSNIWQFRDNVKIACGNSSDLQIYHDGSNSYIADTGTGYLIIKGNRFQVVDAAGSDDIINAVADGAVELYYDNSIKLYTTSTGAQVAGDFRFSDGEAAKWGNSQDLQIYHNGSSSVIHANSNDLYIKGNSINIQSNNNEASGYFKYNGAVELYYDNSKKFETWTSGARLPADNSVLAIGAGDDLRFWHNATNSIIRNATGELQIQSNTLKLTNFNATETYLKGVENGSTEIYHDNNKKLETTSSGIDVTGAITVNGSPLSSAPTITATASGAIASGKAVIVNSNGTVSQPAITAPAFGSATQLSTDNTNGHHDIIWCQTHNCFIYVYKKDSNGYLYMKAGTLSGTTITWGSEVMVSNQSNGYTPKIAYDSSNDVIFLVYRNGGNSYRGEIRQIQISGTTIGTISAAGTPYSNNYIEQLNLVYGNGACILTFKYASQGRAVKVTANSNAANHPNLSSSYQIESNNYNSSALVYDPDTDKFVTCWNDQDSTAGRSRVMTLEPNGSISMSSTTDWISDYTDYISLSYNTNLNKYLVVFQRNQSNGYKNLYSAVGTYSGGTITWANEVEHTTTHNERHMNSAYNPTTYKHSVYWQAGNDSNKLKHADITISGTTPSLGTVTTVSTVGSDGEYNETAINNSGAEVNISDTNNDEYYAARSPQSTTLTASNFIGFASAAYSNGNTATVKVVGNTVTGLSGLTAGAKSYVQGDGSVGVTATEPSVEAGTALSSTKVLIKG